MDLCAKGKRRSAAKDTTDPQDGLMSMMKDLYEDGSLAEEGTGPHLKWVLLLVFLSKTTQTGPRKKDTISITRVPVSWLCVSHVRREKKEKRKKQTHTHTHTARYARNSFQVLLLYETQT